MLTPLRIRLTYFFALFGSAIGWAYLGVYMKECGIDEFHIGLVLGLGTLSSGITSWQSGKYIGKTISAQKAISIGCFLSSIGFICLGFAKAFPAFLGLNILFSLGTTLFMSSIPILALSTLSDDNRGRGLGYYRMFGSIGFMMSTLCVGGLSLWLDLRHIFMLGGAFFMLPVIVLWKTDANHKKTSKEEGGITLSPQLKTQRLLLFAAVFTYAFSFPSNFPFIALYAKSLGATTSQVSYLLGGCGALAIIGLLFLGRMSDKWGAEKLLLLGFAMQPIRSLGYSFVSNHYFLHIPQLLHILTFCSFEVCLPIVAGKWFTEKHQQRIYGQLLTACFIGIVCGNIMAGQLIKTFDYRVMYQANAGVTFLSMIFFWLAWRKNKMIGDNRSA